jgi:hypothetical protein
MTRRLQHNIESNCVAFDDACYDETNYSSSILEIDRREINWFMKLINKLFNS